MAVLKEYLGYFPKIAKSAFIAENAVIIGNVTIGEQSSVWYNCVIRGDVEEIKIGNRTNIQDGTIIHVSRYNNGSTVIGDEVTVGHMAMLHACTIHDRSFIGMKAAVLDYAVVENMSMVGAGSVVTPRKTVISGELWTGIPAKKLRNMTYDEKEYITISAENYVKLADYYSKY